MTIVRRISPWLAAVGLMAMIAPSRGAVAASDTLHPPVIVLQQLDRLERVDRVEDLPSAIRNGAFDPHGPGWILAEPGGAWNATDAITDPTLPGRRLIFGACGSALCLVHYERGGIAHFWLVAAFARPRNRWQLVWTAEGSHAIRDLAELRAVLRNRSKLRYVAVCASSCEY